MAAQEQIKDVLALSRRLIFDPRMSRWTSVAQLLGEVALCGLIIWKVPYTNIDWTAYMQQTEQYLAGERDYRKIAGDTGPLVYPGAHVYIYRALHGLTSSGSDIGRAQVLFAVLYLMTLGTVLGTYRAAGAPPWVLALLSLSKRAHSVFLLRLFNDGWAVLGLFAAVAAWQRRWWTAGAGLFALGLGVKMVILLALPAVGAGLWQAVGRDRAVLLAAGMGQVQLLLGYPFLAAYPWSYVSRAFEFTRQFQFKWTVNWRFIGEETFLSRPFSLSLLALHISLLTVFLLGRWMQPSSTGGRAISIPTLFKRLIHPPPKDVQASIARQVTPDFILTSVLSAVVIGCLCARSLHYQFYVYIVWATPFLLWRSGMHMVGVVAVFFAQEWAWNVYPSTDLSSSVVVACLAITVASSWIGIRFPTVGGSGSRKNVKSKR